MVSVEPLFFLFCALLLLVLPVPWVAAAFFAALIHEMFHLAAVWIQGGTVREIRVNVGGARITAQMSGKKEELLAVLAGPAGSLLLVSLCHLFPRVAVCGFVQGVYNLLPVSPLDGGRALRCLIAIVLPDKEEQIANILETIAVGGLLLAALYASAVEKMGVFPLLTVLIPVITALKRNNPCKQGRIRVQ